MSTHELWHVAVLATTILGAASVGLVVLSPVLFETPPPGLIRIRPLLLVLGALAAALFLWEWLFVH